MLNLINLYQKDRENICLKCFQKIDNLKKKLKQIHKNFIFHQNRERFKNLYFKQPKKNKNRCKDQQWKIFSKRMQKVKGHFIHQTHLAVKSNHFLIKF